MKRLCLLLTVTLLLSILTACAGQPVETTVPPEQTTASTTETTCDTTTETPVIPPIVDSWKTAVYSKEPWWESYSTCVDSLKNASDGSLVVANNILTQENDSMLVVEAYVFSENLKTYEDEVEFLTLFGFEVFANKSYDYGLHIPLLLASKEQLLSISFSKDYKVGFNLAFASKAFYEELPVSLYQVLAQKYEKDNKYTIYLYLKNPSGHFYVSPEEARALWPLVYEKHPIPPRPSWQYDDAKADREIPMTIKQLYELFASDGFFDDFKVTIGPG